MFSDDAYLLYILPGEVLDYPNDDFQHIIRCSSIIHLCRRMSKGMVADMYQICICDDEAIHRIRLHRILDEYSFQAGRELSIHELDNPDLLLHEYSTYDILFLDIEFPDEKSGVDVARKLREQGTSAIIVFLTSYPDYSIEGYEAEAFRYLLKPPTPEQITNTLNAIFAKWEQANSYVEIKSNDGLVLLDSSSIQLIEVDGRKRLIVRSESVIETWETLKEIYDKLPEWSFAYANKSCIVNLQKVKQIVKADIILIDGTTIPLARRYKQQFLQGISRLINH